jgi:hypothetical protein
MPVAALAFAALSQNFASRSLTHNVALGGGTLAIAHQAAGMIGMDMGENDVVDGRCHINAVSMAVQTRSDRWPMISPSELNSKPLPWRKLRRRLNRLQRRCATPREELKRLDLLSLEQGLALKRPAMSCVVN